MEYILLALVVMLGGGVVVVWHQHQILRRQESFAFLLHGQAEKVMELMLDVQGEVGEETRIRILQVVLTLSSELTAWEADHTTCRRKFW
jgi:hypothetical protein